MEIPFNLQIVVIESTCRYILNITCWKQSKSYIAMFVHSRSWPNLGFSLSVSFVFDGILIFIKALYIWLIAFGMCINFEAH